MLLRVYPGTACQVPGHPRPQQAEPEDQKKKRHKQARVLKEAKCVQCMMRFSVTELW